MYEPTSGTLADDRKALRDLMGEVRSQGITTIVVDHDIEFVRGVCDRVLAMSLWADARGRHG